MPSTLGEIAERCGVTRQTVNYNLRKLGLWDEHVKTGDRGRAAIVDDYASQVVAAKIGARITHSSRTCQREARTALGHLAWPPVHPAWTGGCSWKDLVPRQCEELLLRPFLADGNPPCRLFRAAVSDGRGRARKALRAPAQEAQLGIGSELFWIHSASFRECVFLPPMAELQHSHSPIRIRRRSVHSCQMPCR